MNVCFVDCVCPKPYSRMTLETEALGGSEASVIRVAEGLKQYFNVSVVQHNRKEPQRFYVGDLPDEVDAFVILRATWPITGLKERYPNAQFFLWMHDTTDLHWPISSELVKAAGVTTICVSEWHRKYAIAELKRFQLEVPRIVTIYNPVVTYEEKETKKNKLVFFSSPHKGLARTLDVFRAMQSYDELRYMRLFIANPGYIRERYRLPEGVTDLGAIPHHEVLSHVAESFAVFHMNSVFPETFGLVYAEANQLGVPFLTHRLGALDEVSTHPAQFVDVNSTDDVMRRLIDWQTYGRPGVCGKACFQLPAVLQRWYTLLKGSATAPK